MSEARIVQVIVLGMLLLACGDDAGGRARDATLDSGGGPMEGDASVARADGGDASRSTGDAGDAAVAHARPNYGDLTILPDTATTKVASCTGQPDLTLCDVVTAPDYWYDVCLDGTCVSPGCGTETCATPGPHFRIPPMSGHVHLRKQAGDQPVSIDLITGLHWQSCAAGLTGADCTGGTLMQLDAAAALAYCDSLQWAGHHDWYLPDMHELMSIVDVTVERPRDGYLSEQAFPNRQASTGAFWSSTALDGDIMTLSTGKNLLSFHAIAVKAWSPTDLDSVMCVRRGFSQPMPAGARLVEHKEMPKQPYVEDRATGLSFQACSSGPGATDCTTAGSFSYADAARHCADLTWAGQTDWRLPTYKEAHGLFAYGKAGAFDHGVSEDLFQYAGTYLLVESGPLLDVNDSSRVGIGNATSKYPVLCVRGPLALAR